MTDGDSIREGRVLAGSLFSEPMLVETVAASEPAARTLGTGNTETERFRRVPMAQDQLASLTITSPIPAHAGVVGRCTWSWPVLASSASWRRCADRANA